MSDEAVCFCATGAVYRIINEYNPWANAIILLAAELPISYLKLEVHHDPAPTFSQLVAMYNDNSPTKQKDIVALYDAAIAKLQARIAEAKCNTGE